MWLITIILLLILAGVSISYIINGGIIDKTEVAMNMYENADKKQQNIIDEIHEYMKEEISDSNNEGNTSSDENTTGGGPSVDGNGLATEDTTITTDDPNVQIVIPKGFAPVILQTDRTDSLPGENGAVKEIMPVKDWNSITAEQINKGIVLVDHAITYDGGQTSGTVPDFNEYVWVPMPDSTKFARVPWTVEGNKQNLAEKSTSNSYWQETASTEYTNMVSSVNINKGFYISRYEAGGTKDFIPHSKRGQYPWKDIPQTTAIEVSAKMKPEINSHLIYGIEWDSVLQWLLDSEAKIGSEIRGETKTITIDDIQTDSSCWGNYATSVGGAATDAGRYMHAGGKNEYWKVNNIYNLAGNVWERTQEQYSINAYNVWRGGVLGNEGDISPAASRYSKDEEDLTYLGSRF